MTLGVEVAPNNIVRAIFKTEHKEEVVTVLRNMFTLVEETFGTDTANYLLDPEQCANGSEKMTRELEYARKLKDKHFSNPQSDEPVRSYKPKTRMVFGSYAEAATNLHA